MILLIIIRNEFMNQIFSKVETEKCTRCDDGSVWMWAGARSDSCYCEVMMSSQAQHIPTHLWLLSGQRAQSTTVITHQIWRYATWWCPKATENTLLLLQKTFWHFKGIVLHFQKILSLSGIQNIDEFVSSLEQVWRHITSHKMLIDGLEPCG